MGSVEYQNRAILSAAAALILTATCKIRAIFEAPTCAIFFRSKIASERRFSLRISGTTTKFSKWHFPAGKSVDFPPWGLLTFAEKLCDLRSENADSPIPAVEKVIVESCSCLFV